MDFAVFKRLKFMAAETTSAFLSVYYFKSDEFII